MHFHFLQHVDFEGPAGIANWITQNGHSLSITHLYKNEILPPHQKDDILVVMGGPMGVNDIDRYPWLIPEKQYILEAIQMKQRILGICLGAQLIADVLGSKITKSKHKEIGWHKLKRDQQLEKTMLGDLFPEEIHAFHWHGETFSLPKNARPLASSAACENQGFVIDNRIFGFQFHLETTPESAAALIDNCGDELDDSKYVQSEKQMLDAPLKFEKINAIMYAILAKLVQQKD